MILLRVVVDPAPDRHLRLARSCNIDQYLVGDRYRAIQQAPRAVAIGTAVARPEPSAPRAFSSGFGATPCPPRVMPLEKAG